MGQYFERIASGKLATANGGGAFSQLYDYKLVVCYARDNAIYISTKDPRGHEVGGTGTGMYCFPISGDENPEWTETEVFDHANPTGGDPTAAVVAPPVLWVARSGKYLPGVSPNTPACTRSIIHLAWAVKFTSGTDQDKYRVFHCMRDKDGVWTCAAGTLASLNAVTDLSATTGQWLNVQLLGLRRYDTDNSRYMSYGTAPTAAETTLYLTYFGRASNSGSTPNDIFLTRFGSAGDNYYGNDWDATQSWQPFANHVNASQTAYADDLKQQYTLSKSDRTIAPTAGPPTVYSHTAESGVTNHYLTIGYTRKGLSKSGGTRTLYYPVYRKYHPDTGILDSEADPTLGSPLITGGRDAAVVSTPEQASYLYDSLIVFRPTYGGSSGITDWKMSETYYAPLITGLLNYYETNRSRAAKDGDLAESHWQNLSSYYFRMLLRNQNSGGGGGDEYEQQYVFTGWNPLWPPQHGSCGVSENYLLQWAATITPPEYKYNPRTGSSTQVKGIDAYVAVLSFKYPNYDGCHNYSTNAYVPPATWPGYGAYVPNNYYHPRHGGSRLRYTRHQLHVLSDSQYMLSSGPAANLTRYAFTWPQFGDFDCINPCVFRAPWFQNGTMPYNMSNGFAVIFEAYQTDGVDNSVWLGIRGFSYESWDNASPWMYMDGVGRYYAEGRWATVPGSIETEWTENTVAYNGYVKFAGETVRRTRVRSTILQDQTIYNLIARPTYNVTFNFDVINGDGDLTDRWEQTVEPKVFHGVGQYEATSPVYIPMTLKNQVASVVRTSIVSGRAKIGTVKFAIGEEGETHWEARLKNYTDTLLIDTIDGLAPIVWVKWIPPGSQTNPPTPQAIDIYLRFDQAT